MLQYITLVLVGFVGGIINAIAGGGAIIMFPALLAIGLPPIIANATSSLVVWPGSLTSAYGYRHDLRAVPRKFIWLALPAIAGAFIGAVILTHTKPATFEHLAPWLVLSAVLLLVLQSRIHKFVMAQSKKRKIHWHTFPLICLVTLPLAIYGGYFGAGFGLVVLALLGFSELKNIYQMNGVKNLTAAVMAITATIYFGRSGLINWQYGLTMATGTALGGFTGARLTKHVSTHAVHNITIALGFAIAIVLIVRG